MVTLCLIRKVLSSNHSHCNFWNLNMVIPRVRVFRRSEFSYPYPYPRENPCKTRRYTRTRDDHYWSLSISDCTKWTARCAKYQQSSQGWLGSKWGAEWSHQSGTAIGWVLGAMCNVCKVSNQDWDVWGHWVTEINVLLREGGRVNVKVLEIIRKCRR